MTLAKKTSTWAHGAANLNRIGLGIGAGLVACSAQAQLQDRAGMWEVLLNATEVAPHASSTPLGIVSPTAQVLAGSGFTTGRFATLGVTLRYWWSDRISAELLGAIPRRSSVTGTGTLSANAINPLGHATAISPTVLFRYHLLDATSAWRPSLAVGLNYTCFTRASVSPQFQQYLSTLISRGATTAFQSTGSFSSSWNPAVGAGLTYRLNAQWKIDFSGTYIPMQTTGTLHTDAGGVDVVSQGTIKINPTIWSVGLSRQF